MVTVYAHRDSIYQSHTMYMLKDIATIVISRVNNSG